MDRYQTSRQLLPKVLFADTRFRTAAGLRRDCSGYGRSGLVISVDAPPAVQQLDVGRDRQVGADCVAPAEPNQGCGSAPLGIAVRGFDSHAIQVVTVNVDVVTSDTKRDIQLQASEGRLIKQPLSVMRESPVVEF